MAKKRPSPSEIVLIFQSAAGAIINSDGFAAMDGFIQHGNTSCRTHCLAVAYYSLAAACRLGLRCDMEALVRGALLHDYFLYDWHDKKSCPRFHGFTHPAASLINAERDFKIGRVERDIIHKHMFPLVPLPPLRIESLVVSLADKLCMILEVLHPEPYAYLPLAAAATFEG